MVVTSPPTDGISSMMFSPQADYLATRIYEIQQNGSAAGKAIIQHEAPVLDVCWSTDGSKVFSVGCDKQGKMLDLQTNQTTQVAGHDAPIKSCRFIDGLPNLNNMLVTGSWDKTLKTIASSLKWQTRVVSCFPDATGYALGSIEGRVSIEYVEDKDQGRKFSFRCHRVDKNVFPVNDISFHPQYGTLSTVGGDGGMNFWDKDAKRSLKAHPTAPGPITSSAFNRNGTIFAYGISYDWHKGHEYNVSSNKVSLMLHAVKDDDIKPRPKK
ncbi:hypothetical protein HDV02_003644 [Globomyces sp. JEL0801]|nr:hypothetical protein HDV02_003644 [Globomyces sp. JEL0801]